MEAVKEWVRGLVMLVLVASCLEMLIPMNAMKKYVRMTMGLLIVLAVVSPMAELIGRPVQVDTAALADFGGAEGRIPSLPEIMARAQEFRERNRAMAEGEAAERLGELASDAALSVPGVAGARTTVALRTGAGGQKEPMLTVVVTPGPRFGAVQPVEPVAPGGGRSVAGAPPDPHTRPPDASEAALAEAVRREVVARLGFPVDGDSLEVLIEHGSTRR